MWVPPHGVGIGMWEIGKDSNNESTSAAAFEVAKEGERADIGLREGDGACD